MTPEQNKIFRKLQEEGKPIRAAVIRFGYMRTALLMLFFFFICFPYMAFSNVREWWHFRNFR